MRFVLTPCPSHLEMALFEWGIGPFPSEPNLCKSTLLDHEAVLAD